MAEAKQNHVDEVKPISEEPGNSSEEVPKAEEPLKSSGETSENGAATETAAAPKEPASVMDVDEDETLVENTPSANKEKALDDEKEPEQKSEEHAAAVLESKEQNEPAKEPTPEPMEVDGSSKGSSDTAQVDTPAIENVSAAPETEAAAKTTESSNDVVEVATEGKATVLEVPAAEPKEAESTVESAEELTETSTVVVTEPKEAASCEEEPSKVVDSAEPKEAESNTDESATPVPIDVSTAPASNDVSKPLEIDTTLVKTADSPAKEPQEICEVKKAEINVNGKLEIPC